MTVYNFIEIYNETFKYIEKEYGAEAVKDLWQTISAQWCVHLDDLVREKGLEGMGEYWAGNGGTLGREKAVYEISLQDGVLAGIMHKCPSVGELIERNRKIYHGELNYCNHCLALYGPVANRYSFEMLWNIDTDEAGRCTGKCSWTSYKK